MLEINGKIQKDSFKAIAFNEIWNLITLSIITQEPINIVKISLTINGFKIIVNPITNDKTPIIRCTLIVLNSLNSEK